MLEIVVEAGVVDVELVVGVVAVVELEVDVVVEPEPVIVFSADVTA